MNPSDDDLDLSLNGKMLSERIQDPEGYDMCHKVAIKEGILAATCAMSLTGLAIIGAKRKLSTLYWFTSRPNYIIEQQTQETNEWKILQPI
jgi:hypothetical protein